MAAPSYDNDLTLIADAEATTETSPGIGGTWTSYNGTGGSSLGAGEDFSMQGVNAIDMKITSSNGTRGPIFGATTAPSLGTNERWFIWTYVATPGILASTQGPATTGGTAAFFGNSSASNGAHYIFNLETADSFGSASRVGQCYAIDPAGGPGVSGETNGSPAEPWDFIGSVATFSANSKGSNFATDAIRRGTGLYVTLGESADPITISGIAAYDDLKNNRWGVLLPLGGTSFEQQGTVAIGQTSGGTPTDSYFEDKTGASITFKTLRSGASAATLKDFHKFIVDGTNTTFILANASFVDPSNLSSTASSAQILFNNGTSTVSGVTTTGVGDIQVASAATASFNRCVFNFGRPRNGAGARIDASSGSGTFTNCTFELVDLNLNDYGIHVGSASQLVNCTFTATRDVNNSCGHAVNLGTINTAQTISWNNFSTGFAASNGTQGERTILVNYTDTTNPLVISVGAGYQTPSVYNTGGGQVNVVTAQTTLTLTGLVANSEVRIYSAGTTTELIGVENSGTTFQYSYTYAASTFVDIVIHNVGYVYQRLANFELGSSNASIPITQIFDRNYSNP